VSLPDAEVLDLLDEFVVGQRNIHKDEHVGLSHGYKKNQTAVGTTNGAGGRNVQLVVMAADETVLHVLPGFWHPEDLVRELRFALSLHRLWLDEQKTLAEKERLYTVMHRAHVLRFSPDTIARSDWQGFDRHHEAMRLQQEPRDTFVRDGTGTVIQDNKQGPRIKPVCTLVHDRMLARPFRQLARFDMETFVDYGRPYYDNNEGLDKGAKFPAAARANEKRAKEQAKQRYEEARAAAEAAKAQPKGKGKPAGK